MKLNITIATQGRKHRKFFSGKSRFERCPYNCCKCLSKYGPLIGPGFPCVNIPLKIFFLLNISSLGKRKERERERRKLSQILSVKMSFFSFEASSFLRVAGIPNL